MNIKLYLSVLLLTLMLLSQNIKAQDAPSVPDREIHLFDLKLIDGQYQLDNGKNISNNKGYDNQAYFTPESKTVLFVSERQGKSTDVFEYNIKTEKTQQLTNTPHAEYSPKPVGNTGNVSFVSEGFNPYQSVWQLDRKTGEQSWLLNSKEPVGYYHLNESTGDVLFWSRYGWSVQYLNIKTKQNRFVSGHAIPSTPQQIPKSDQFSFVHRQTNGQVWIKSFDPKTFSITPIAPIFDSNYEYGWAPNGDILRFKNNQLFVWPAGNTGFEWQKGPDLKPMVKGEIGRLAISNDGKKLALVESK